MSTLSIGMKVRILRPLLDNSIEKQGTIYNYLPSRPWPWHVRPGNWAEAVPGIAFTEAELEPMGTQLLKDEATA